VKTVHYSARVGLIASVRAVLMSLATRSTIVVEPTISMDVYYPHGFYQSQDTVTTRFYITYSISSVTSLERKRNMVTEVEICLILVRH